MEDNSGLWLQFRGARGSPAPVLIIYLIISLRFWWSQGRKGKGWGLGRATLSSPLTPTEL